MKTIVGFIRPLFLTLPVLMSLAASTVAQEVQIPDAGLNLAVRQALGKPENPLTVQDMLNLTNLNARNRDVRNISGLEAALNLGSLDLRINHLTNVDLLSGLSKLSMLDLSGNPLASYSLPGELTNLTSLIIESAGLTNLVLSTGHEALTNLDLEGNSLTSLDQLSSLTGLVGLDLGFNAFTSFFFPVSLTNVSTFYFAGNPLTNLVMAPGLSGMTELNLSQNLLSDFTLPAGMKNLDELDLAFNQLTRVDLPDDLGNLATLELDFNQLSFLNFPPGLTNLSLLHLRANQFTNFTLPAALTGLTYLDVSTNPVSSITLPGGLTNLAYLRFSNDTNLTSLTLPLGLINLKALFLAGNKLTNLVLPPDLNNLESLNVSGNQLTRLNLPAGLTNLTGLFFVANELTNITVPPDITRLNELGYLANPLNAVVVSEVIATNLAADIDFLRNQGVPIFIYPLEINLVQPQPLTNAFKFGITGPPGIYTILGSADFAAWNAVGMATNSVGALNFPDTSAQTVSNRFYRAHLLQPPANMVFIPANTFLMGAPTNELHRQPDEGPQTTVTISYGFWIGKYEVTQREYVAVLGANPSSFPGDLDRPVESVSWLDATNYCAILTRQDLSAGRILPGTHYRLPTEAEWECAARAGTRTRFSYGDDPNYESLTNHAWYFANSGNMPHPVGQKAANPWGLYDMTGNVWEWCQDWYGPYAGGSVTDPQGPASNVQGVKVIRGGAWDDSETSCRSGRRLAKGVSPFITDYILGFRVVLVPDEH